jgi:recombination protein RecT
MASKHELTVYEKARASAEMLFKDRSLSGRFSKLKTAPLKWDSEKSFALQQVMKNEYLAATVVANPLSLVNSMIDVASLGVSLSPTRGHAYLIPENIAGRPTVTVVVGYKGLEHLVLSSKSVRSIATELVYANDTFERGIRDGVPYADFKMARGDRGALEGGFCMAKLANGEMHVEWMSVEDIEGCHQAAIKKQKGKDPFTWTGPFKPEMQKKCIVRRASKHWVLPDNLVAALAMIDKAEPMDFSEPEDTMAVQIITEEHDAAVRKPLLELGMERDHITIWMDRQVQAWGHKGIDTYPDDGWERLRDALLERHQKVQEAKQASTSTPAEGAAP